jgi:hypothetical protein
MKTTTLCRPSDDVRRCCWSTCPRSVDRSSRLRDGSCLRYRPRLKPGGTKQLYEVGPASPFEKRTVAVASDASETSPCRRTGQAKRRARHPWVDGVGRRHTAGIETRVWSGRPPSCRVRLSSCALGRRAASVGRWSGLSRVLTVRSPIRGPIPNGVGPGVCRSATREVEPQKSVAIGRGRRCCPSSACSSPGRAGGSRVGIRRRSSLLLQSGFGFVPVTPLCH